MNYRYRRVKVWLLFALAFAIFYVILNLCAQAKAEDITSTPNPRVTSVVPQGAFPGQMITILGHDFLPICEGESLMVWFVNPSTGGVYLNYNYYQVRSWGENYIDLVLPSSLPGGTYEVIVLRGSRNTTAPQYLFTVGSIPTPTATSVPTSTPTAVPERILGLSSICHQDGVGRMVVRNPNNRDIPVHWYLAGVHFPPGISTEGDILALANGQTNFNVPWPGNVVIIYEINGVREATFVRQSPGLCQTPTPTHTPLKMDTPIKVPSATATAIATAVPKSTETLVPSPTSVPTNTPTSEPTVTNTPTAVPTMIPSPTATPLQDFGVPYLAKETNGTPVQGLKIRLVREGTVVDETTTNDRGIGANWASRVEANYTLSLTVPSGFEMARIELPSGFPGKVNPSGVVELRVPSGRMTGEVVFIFEKEAAVPVPGVKGAVKIRK